MDCFKECTVVIKEISYFKNNIHTEYTLRNLIKKRVHHNSGIALKSGLYLIHLLIN